MGTHKNNELLIKSSFEFPCSYIEGKLERRLCVSIIQPNSNQIISELTKKGFRRNYNHMYLPSCRDCNSCIPSRINIKKFVFSKSNKRNIKNNNDLMLIENKKYSENRYSLFRKYCEIRHEKGLMKKMTENEFINFFHKSINQTKIFDLIDSKGVLYGSILLDVLNDGYSAVYSFFNPNLKKRGLGKNIILQTINKLKKENSDFLYIGYWIKESENMKYKSSFNNVEYLTTGTWDSKRL
jgi:arginine-tRNA-protein transferase